MSEEDGAESVGATPPPAPRRNLLPVLILLLLAFALGVALTLSAPSSSLMPTLSPVIDPSFA